MENQNPSQNSENQKTQAVKASSLLDSLSRKWQEHLAANAARTGVKPAETISVQSSSASGDATPESAPAPTNDSNVSSLLEAQKVYEEGMASIKDLIAPSSMQVEYDAVYVSGMWAQSFFVYTYPHYLETNWLSPIVNSDTTMDLSMFIYPIDTAKVMKQLKNKTGQLSSSLSINAEKGNVRDPQLEQALEDVEGLRDRLQRGEEKFFQLGLYFTIYADDKEKIKKQAKAFESLLGGQLIFSKRADLRAEQALNSCMPQAEDEIGVLRNMNTGPLSTTFPFVSSELSSDKGILYGLNRHNNTLIIFDRFSLPNANSMVLATSGGGKSYAIKLEILRSLMFGADVICIDPENEYEALSKTVGGSYFRVSMESEQRINPFDLPVPFEGEDSKPGELLRQNLSMMAGLLALMLGGKMTSSESAIIDQALIDTYALKGITMDTKNPGSVPSPIMSDLHAVLSAMEGGEDLARRLAKFVTGTFGGIFNHPTNVNLKTNLVVFSIRDLEDQLRPMAMYVILNYIWNVVRSKLKKRILVLEEAWQIMQYEDSAKFLYGLIKRARKYFLGITTITQDVEDFLKSPYGKPVVTNSSMQLLLKQAPSALESLNKIFNLTEGESDMLLASDKGQGIFFAGRNHAAIQIIASYGEHQIITTDPEELLKQASEEA